MTHRHAPNNVGRTPLCAPSGSFRTRTALARFQIALKPFQRVVSHIRLVMAGAVPGDKSRPQEPLPAAPAGLSSEDAHGEPGCDDCALRQDCCEGSYSAKRRAPFHELVYRWLDGDARDELDRGEVPHAAAGAR